MSFLAVLLSAGAGVGIGFAAHRFAPPFPPVEAAPPAPSASAEPAPSASEAPAASASAPPSASAAPPPVEPSVCMQGLFADKTFAEPPSLDFVCDEADPIKGASRVKETVVKGSRGTTTGGQKEWAVLGFYELAAFAVLKGRCCQGEPTFQVPAAPESCEALDGALVKLARAAQEGSSDEDADAAVKTFTGSVKCIAKNKLSKSFGGFNAPGGGEATTFQKTLDRARGVEPKAD